MPNRSRRGRPNVDPTILSRLDDLARVPGRSGAEIARLLFSEFGDRAPGERAVQARLENRSEMEPWLLSAVAPSAQLHSVLGVLAFNVEDTSGGLDFVPTSDVPWIQRIAAATPDIDMPRLSNLAYRLGRRDAWRTGDMPGLEVYLAFAPWRDQGARYRRAQVRGWIKDPIHLADEDSEAPA